MVRSNVLLCPYCTSSGLVCSELMTMPINSLTGTVVHGLNQRSQELLNTKLAAFRYGELAYSKGEYKNSALAFQIAVDEAGPQTVAGGEASIWLGLAYQVQRVPLFSFLNGLY